MRNIEFILGGYRKDTIYWLLVELTKDALFALTPAFFQVGLHQTLYITVVLGIYVA